MLPTTIEVVKTVLRTDPSVSPSERARLLALLREGPEKPEAASAAPEPRLIRRAETARRLAVSLRAVDQWALQGILKKVRLPGRARACGFRETDIVALIEGRTA